MRLYEKAVGLAREHGFIQNEGLAHELAARFYAARGFETIANAYLRNARDCYLRWRADGKVHQLDLAHPHLRQQSPRQDFDSMLGTPVEHLDLATVVKVSQAVSCEIDLRKLVDILMTTGLENAGADRGLLILPQSDELWIEAEAIAAREPVEVRIRRSRVTPSELPELVLQYVIRSQGSVLLADASDQNPFSDDKYFTSSRCRSVLCLPLVKQSRLIAVLYLENSQTPHVFTPARMAVLSLLASQAAISLENAYLYTNLKRAEEHLGEAQRLSRMGSWVWDLATNKVLLSEEHCRIFGFTRDQLVSSYQLGLDTVHPEDRDGVRNIVENATRLGQDFSCEFRIVLPNGSSKHLHAKGTHTTNDFTGADEYIGTVMDITERKRADENLKASLEEKEILLKEVHHRVKNNLQLISSLLNLQAARNDDPCVAEQFADSRNRVRSMALVHENLYRTGNFARIPMSTHIQSLCAHLIRAYGLHSQRVGLVAEVDEIELDLDRAISCGLIINELVSNAFKHAFPDGRAGNIQVQLKLLEGTLCALAVFDDGVGISSDPVDPTSSMGMQLVNDLALQLHGVLSVRCGPGTSFTIAFDSAKNLEEK